jgi:Domain of unknown function (DUF397)
MIGSAWRKSSASSSNSNCIEVRGRDDAVDVRDSKDPHGPVLSFGSGEWVAFVAAVKLGEFDL